jgi:hypothetical protein
LLSILVLTRALQENRWVYVFHGRASLVAFTSDKGI